MGNRITFDDLGKLAAAGVRAAIKARKERKDAEEEARAFEYGVIAAAETQGGTIYLPEKPAAYAEFKNKYPAKDSQNHKAFKAGYLSVKAKK